MKKLLVVAAMAVTLCLSGLVMPGEAQAEQAGPNAYSSTVIQDAFTPHAEMHDVVKRFWDNGNGTVTDSQTRRMWTKDANIFGFLTWVDANARCSSFGISGVGNWRLPDRDELVVLFNAIQQEHPFINYTYGSYWT